MEWISVKDRFPEPHKDVLCYYESGRTVIDFYGNSGFTFIFDGEVTRWQPLPEPPKEY